MPKSKFYCSYCNTEYKDYSEACECERICYIKRLPEVAKNLIIMGNDFWLERYERNGAEGWEYKEKEMKEPEMNFKLKAVTVGQAEALGFNTTGYCISLEKINGLD